MNKNILIVIGITILFLGPCIIPTVAMDNLKESHIIQYSGKTLYVGGSGEGNYTKIQDAIDDASDGDTVFVYDDSSPYYENVIVDKSINLIGEDKETTVVDGGRIGSVVIVTDPSSRFLRQNLWKILFAITIQLKKKVRQILSSALLVHPEKLMIFTQPYWEIAF